jgi:hypothetical protein
VYVVTLSSQYILLLLNTFGVTVNCVTVIQFSSQYVLLLLNTFGVTVNCVTVIQFSSQYILLLLNTFGVTVNCVTVIQFSSQYVMLFLFFSLCSTELHALRPHCCYHQLQKRYIIREIAAKCDFDI